ncbi:large subunit terminase [Caudoviricetes sp.]|nr:large subunit terminase [Caudoviricetes sp.]
MRQLSKGGLRSYLYRQTAEGLTLRDTVVSIPWAPIALPPDRLADRPWLEGFSSPQDMAFHSEADILGYGGGAGGGKTDVAIGKAVKKHHRTLIVRREFTQLKGAIERAKEVIGKAGRYNSQDKFYRLPGGKRIEFGGIEHDGDEEAWQGRDHDLKVFDEATHFKESTVRYVCIWNRTTRPGQRCQTLLTFNPPTTPTGAWVYQWFKPWLDKDFPNPAQPGELRYYVTLKGKDVPVQPTFEVELPDGDGARVYPLEALPEGAKVEFSKFRLPRVTFENRTYLATASAITFDDEPEPLIPLSRTFIPARTTDNPNLTPQYLAQLDALPEPLRSMFKYGRFDVLSEDEPWQVFPSAWVSAAMKRWTEKSEAERGRLDAIAADIARGGQGETAIAKRYGSWFAPLVVYPGIETPDGPSAATLIFAEHEGDADILVDVGGPGGSPYDALKSLVENPGFRGRVEPINFASASDMVDRSGRLRMRNLRAAMHWNLRQLLDPDFGDEIALPPDEDLKLDLLSLKWKLTSGGVLIEEKEKAIERTGRGFHRSDAVVMAAWIVFRAQVSSDPNVLRMLSPSSSF